MVKEMTKPREYGIIMMVALMQKVHIMSGIVKNTN